MPRLLLALVAPAVVSFATGCSDRSVPTRPDPSLLDGPAFAKVPATPTLDGVIGADEYTDAASLTFDATLPAGAGGGSTPVTVYITHDETDLYLAVTFDRRSAFHLNDIVAFEFDSDNDGVRENGDDIVLTGPTSTPGVVQPGADYYRFDNGAANQSDFAGGGTIDVSSVFGVSSTSTVGVFEFRHDLNSADDAHDFSISVPPPRTVGMLVQISLEDDPAGVNTYVQSFKPSSTTYCHLSIAKKGTTVSCPP